MAASRGADSVRYSERPDSDRAASHRFGGWNDGEHGPMPDELLAEIVREVSAIPGVAGVFYDLTNKPPATIEWE
jgi:hypothetical protein